MRISRSELNSGGTIAASATRISIAGSRRGGALLRPCACSAPPPAIAAQISATARRIYGVLTVRRSTASESLARRRLYRRRALSPSPSALALEHLIRIDRPSLPRALAGAHVEARETQVRCIRRRVAGRADVADDGTLRDR